MGCRISPGAVIFPTWSYSNRCIAPFPKNCDTPESLSSICVCFFLAFLCCHPHPTVVFSLQEEFVESCLRPCWPSTSWGVLHPYRPSTQLGVYSSTLVQSLYISCYLSDNKPVLSYLLSRLLPQVGLSPMDVDLPQQLWFHSHCCEPSQ